MECFLNKLYKNLKLMRTVKFFLIVFVLPLIAFTTAHKYYVSVTQIDYIKEKESVQITTRIFIDDFESLLQQRYDEDIILSEKEEPKKVNMYIEKYLKEKIKIKINNEDAILNFIGKEYEDDIVNCYLEIENVKEIKSFEITNHVLYDLYKEQQNIIRTFINSKHKSFILIPENDKGLLNFD